MNFKNISFDDDQQEPTFQPIRRTKPQQGQKDPKRDKTRKQDFGKNREQKRSYFEGDSR